MVAKILAKGVILGGLLVTAVLAGACGRQAVPSASEPKQVDITLSEFKVESSRIAFVRDTTYQFKITNKGQFTHEFMVMPPGHQGHMASVLHVEADDLPSGGIMTQDIIFPAAGTYEMDCHLPGHYEAGMKLLVEVI